MNKKTRIAVTVAEHELFVRKQNISNPDIIVARILREAFENRKFHPGQVAFSKSQFHDPHVQKIMAEITKQAGVSQAVITATIMAEMQKIQDIATVAPILYGTIKDNIVESSLFKLFEKHKIKTKGPTFDASLFTKLISNIRGELDKFFPLRGFIDQKHLHRPNIIFVGTGYTDPPAPKGESGDGTTGEQTDTTKDMYASVDTAAASPNGEFIFNVDFMQRLLDYAHLKQIKPKGKKYVSNGGNIPDEYGYLEFVILHEFMHYTEEDFHYQKIIPDANPQIINWVGDFRTNYLLVKSGYEQLPMGLFNDHINLDRQVLYIDMYNLVKSEFEKLNKEQQKRLGKALDKLGDDHGPGQQQGKGSGAGKDGKDGQGNPIDPNKISEKARATERQMKEGKDMGPNDKPGEGEGKPGSGGKGPERGGPGSKKNAEPTKIDYTKIHPRFNWAQLVKQFVSSAKFRTEETYQKPSRRGVSGIHIAAQVGAAAIKPAEVKTELKDMRLGFVVDSSGSMTAAITTVYANINMLLKQPMFKNSLFTLLKFSGSHIIYKANFAKNIAAKVEKVTDIPKKFETKVSEVFSQHIGSATNFDSALLADIQMLLKLKTNILIFSDTDILAGTNLTNLLSILKTHNRSVFILFDSRASYLQFRQTTGIATPNISYIE
ncbi:MAG: hypothetical protein ACREAU_00210 [Nitrosopumilaceae archaeon]